MAFHEIRFPANLSFGALGGPERRTEIVELANGYEERNTPWAASRRRYDAGAGLRALDDLEAMIAFFEARQGRLHGFRWKDWGDYRSARASSPITAFDQLIGTGDGGDARFRLAQGLSLWRADGLPRDCQTRCGQRAGGSRPDRADPGR